MARLTVWQPFADMMALNAVMDQAQQNRLNRRSSAQAMNMPVDLSENADAYKLEAVLPGIHPDHVTIDFADDVLTIRAENQSVQDQEGVRYHLRERVAGTYERAFRFPLQINADAIEARFEHGVLTLHLPKAEAVKPRRISVQTSA